MEELADRIILQFGDFQLVRRVSKFVCLVCNSIVVGQGRFQAFDAPGVGSVHDSMRYCL